MIRRLLAVLVVAALVVVAALWSGLVPPWLVGIVPGAASEPVRRTDTGGLRSATGLRVVDGDTMDVRLGGRTVRVRLLNIDAPEKATEGRPAQCLAKAARVKLAELAGKGTSLKVETFGKDADGRTLAAVYNNRRVLLNAELVRAGLAAPKLVNDRVDLSETVVAAQNAAAAAGVGLHARTGCTLAGRLAAAETALKELPVQARDAAEAARRSPQARAVAEELDVIGRELQGKVLNPALDALTKWEQGELKTRHTVASARIAVVISALGA